MTPEAAREIALSLPGVTEVPHHGRPSYRAGGRILATLPDDERLNVMIDPDDVDAAVADEPETCAPLWWGRRLRGVVVALPVARSEVVGALLHDALRHASHA